MLFVYFFETHLNADIQSGLPAHGDEDGIWLFLFDDIEHERRSHRKEVYVVGHAFARLHSRDVWVDQDGLDAFFSERFDRLRSGVVELSGLADG